MAEAVALARAQESLADPLLPQAKRTILLTSESEYTDTDDDSYSSEEGEEGNEVGFYHPDDEIATNMLLSLLDRVLVKRHILVAVAVV